MPDERVGDSYRIRHVSDGHERIAREHIIIFVTRWPVAERRVRPK
jgi:hypothetical protein